MCHDGCVLSTVYDICVCRLSNTSAKFVWKLRPQPSMGGELTQLRFTLSNSGQRKAYTVDKTSSGIVRGGLMNKEYRLSVVLVWNEGDRLYFQPDSKDLGRLQTGGETVKYLNVHCSLTLVLGCLLS